MSTTADVVGEETLLRIGGGGGDQAGDINAELSEALRDAIVAVVGQTVNLVLAEVGEVHLRNRALSSSVSEPHKVNGTYGLSVDRAVQGAH